MSDSRYLVKQGLCGRTNPQSFINAGVNEVDQVCRTGKRKADDGNLCISASEMEVYDVISYETNKKCSVTKVTGSNHKVVLACNNVSNRCLPVHYEKWNNQKADRVNCSKSKRPIRKILSQLFKVFFSSLNNDDLDD